jgi:probable phosphomutase (TIGR03848 family)
VTTFFLVRHGVTSHTGHKLTGWLPDVHLTDDGRAQAEAVAKSLAGIPFEAVYSSPIERTMETAQPIARVHGLRVHRRRSLGEIEFGRWTNRSFKSLVKTRLWSQVQKHPSAFRFPDGESFLEVQHRAVEELESLHGKHERGAVVCVSHADVIKLIASHYIGAHVDLFQRIEIGPGSTTVIALGGGGPRVLAVNVPPTQAGSE